MARLGGQAVSKLVMVLAAVIVIVAIASFLGGMEVGRPTVSQQLVIQVLTVTLPIRTTVTQIVTYQQPVVQTPAQIPDKIVIGVAIALSGSYSDAGKRVLAGIQAAIKWVNDVYGGVKLYGRGFLWALSTMMTSRRKISP